MENFDFQAAILTHEGRYRTAIHPEDEVVCACLRVASAARQRLRSSRLSGNLNCSFSRHRHFSDNAVYQALRRGSVNAERLIVTTASVSSRAVKGVRGLCCESSAKR